jgi:hypothetical protein
VGVPSSVLVAQRVDFGCPITGYLCCTEFRPPVLTGFVFNDARRRFQQGAHIRTSAIQKVFLSDGYLLCQTLSGSTYVVVHWQHENGEMPLERVLH